MNRLGTSENPLQVAVIGSGPSGFYAAESLFKSDITAVVDMYERLPTPFGLVRSGVAPDHQKLKQAIKLYEKIADNENFNLVANVSIGSDVSVDELKAAYHAVIITSGAESDRKLGIAGEQLTGSHTATEFVGWYNGHPDYRDREFDLTHETAVIIGQGNVAIDVARILSKTIDELKHTDIAQHALDVLAESKIKNIHVIGRRGPAQAKFTPKELREFGSLDDCDPIINKTDLILNTESQVELEDRTNISHKKTYEHLCEFAERISDANKKRQCKFHFLLSPVELIGEEKLEKIVFEKNQLTGEALKQSAVGTGENIEMEAGILFRSIGYLGVAIAGVPFNEKWGTIENKLGRVTDEGNHVPQLYTAGWIKRGPSGIIGTNRACSAETVSCLLEDLDQLAMEKDKAGFAAIKQQLEEKNVRFVNFKQWKQIDAVEIKNGEEKDKPREKFTRRQEMLSIIK
ncbi:MAG: FAD-dependent oxidoreductase [Pseudomonadota bacterium]